MTTAVKPQGISNNFFANVIWDKYYQVRQSLCQDYGCIEGQTNTCVKLLFLTPSVC